MKNQSKDKHPLCIRWNHWINFPILFVMIWSGLLIYWAYPVYFLPASLLKSLGFAQRLAEGISWHFVFAWIFALNGLVYVLYLFISGDYKYLIPRSEDLKALPSVVLHDLGIRKKSPAPVLKYNAAQKIAYSSVLLMGIGSLLTGLSIYKPVQFSFLLSLLGGYTAARLEHFILTILFLLFFLIHVIQVARAGWINFRSMIIGNDVVKNKKRAKWSIALWALGLISIGISLRFISQAEKDNKISWVLRKGLNLQGDFWKFVFRENARAKSVKTNPTFRVNGSIGMKKEIDLNSWKLQMSDLQNKNVKSLNYEDLKKLPLTTTSFEFKCIEGWSQMIECKGIKFSDLIEATGIGFYTDEFSHQKTPYQYASIKTVDESYYVSIDSKTFMHPQTILCLEMNGSPLSIEHGFPLRLATPLKYGVKNIKQIGSIQFTEKTPPDYWQQKGYDEYLGL